jgi:hypothetical protein
MEMLLLLSKVSASFHIIIIKCRKLKGITPVWPPMA